MGNLTPNFFLFYFSETIIPGLKPLSSRFWWKAISIAPRPNIEI